MTKRQGNYQGRKGPRPHLWRYQDPLEHEQHIAWMRMKAQADFRGEPWALSFDEFKLLWLPHWHQRGRASNEYCLSREDPEGAWIWGNVQCIQRVEYLRRQKFYRQRTKNGKL